MNNCLIVFFLDLLHPMFNVARNEAAVFQTNCIIRITLDRNRRSQIHIQSFIAGLPGQNVM